MILEKLVKRFFRFRALVKDINFVETQVNLDNHIHTVNLEKSEDEEESHRQIVSKWASKPLNYEIPLWEIVLIYSHDKKQTSMMWRVHHCIGDGPSLFWMFSELCEAKLPEFPIPRMTIFSLIVFYLWIVFGSLIIIWKWTKIFIYGQPKTCLKPGQLGTKKNFAWNATIDLDHAKSVAHKMNGKINDLMLTVLMGAFDRFRLRHDGKGNTEWINVGIPMTMRTEKITEIDNHFAFCVAEMPLGIKDPLARLKKIKALMDYNKMIPEQYFAFGFSWICQRLFPNWIVKNFGTVTSNRNVTAVMTNVCGFPDQIKFLGLDIPSLPIVFPISFMSSLYHHHTGLELDVPCFHTMEKSTLDFLVTI